MLEGDHIKVTASKHSFPTVCKEDQSTDWFNSLQTCLHWNKRERQKSFAFVESATQKSSPSTPNRKYSRRSPSSGTSSPQSQRKNEQPSLDSLSDKVFTMFIDDEYRRESDEDEEYDSSRRFFESSDEDSLADTSLEEDGFRGWTDNEISEARSAGQILENLEMRKLSP